LEWLFLVHEASLDGRNPRVNCTHSLVLAHNKIKIAARSIVMPEDQKPIADQSIEPAPAQPPEPELDEDTGDFITRHVLEKDSVFFEG